MWYMRNMEANGHNRSCGGQCRLFVDAEARAAYDRRRMAELQEANRRLHAKPRETQRIVVDPFVLDNGLPASFGPQPGD